MNQRAFDSILSMAQNMLRRASEREQTAITPQMIERELKKLELVAADDFDEIDRDALVEELIRRSSRTVGENATLSSGEDHIPWLNADRKRNWSYWRRYSEYMETRLPWTALDALDVATDDVLGQLEDPSREGAWDRRGLVVGHVQSGKTGNYTGLICKAADAGYKIIIVLAGLHNNLRSQTQIRLDEGFLGFATISDGDELPAVGVGLIDADSYAADVKNAELQYADGGTDERQSGTAALALRHKEEQDGARAAASLDTQPRRRPYGPGDGPQARYGPAPPRDRRRVRSWIGRYRRDRSR